MLCTRCGKDKTRANFYPRERGGKSLKAVCKTCISERNRRYYAKHRQLLLARANARRFV